MNQSTPAENAPENRYETLIMQVEALRNRKRALPPFIFFTTCFLSVLWGWMIYRQTSNVLYCLLLSGSVTIAAYAQGEAARYRKQSEDILARLDVRFDDSDE
ncbi:hypothetical protein [Propionivibrio dicarboxylicus]|uniref:Uncharacterized protein n=1 Tax=Propionivibrio dicarboxylicus TaxID=83767 RepID=A0A1G8LQM1_9RHOO|nr:hypothetical protein [Propionivibrio dicarboxylicus]SDI57966.1 hypothetical protein SAMN05660652_03680 [Propionivibrio dicarboxylicus]